MGLFPCSAFIDLSQTQIQTERKGLFRKKLNGQVASGGWLSPLYWRSGKMSLLWRPLQQIGSWLDEWPPGQSGARPPCDRTRTKKGTMIRLNWRWDFSIKQLTSGNVYLRNVKGLERERKGPLSDGLPPPEPSSVDPLRVSYFTQADAQTSSFYDSFVAFDKRWGNWSRTWNFKHKNEQNPTNEMLKSRKLKTFYEVRTRKKAY